ncbi:DUF6702 family protein [Lutimonas zeaxanthinifaciens]|uniref:DUF6702 family protein n=1 Tax=Lutimonas zeaxanthinifaciens TaxID=3060215 RepID=UPI00265CF20B|nr:DUF6702 family protein [Lutimonas sp. YSD2104]WKK66857.1 hypothetical protein QZH61_04370 [Lutimonas sp. YSD2104]
MRKYFFLFIFLTIPLISFTLHKHYVSLTQIEYIEDKEAVQVTMRCFLDDIEEAIEDRTGEKLELASQNEHERAGFYLESYIKNKFSIWIDGVEMNYNFLGKEYENDEVFFYMELENIDKINSISIQNSILLEAFEEQQNIVKLKINGIEKTIILVKANDKEMLKF